MITTCDPDNFRGCLVGGAIGDALGYPVEFMTWEQIQERYGEAGIQAYDLKDGIAQISDDTQMTLFTANGLLVAATRNKGEKKFSKQTVKCIHKCYKDWLRTQGGHFDKTESNPISWLYHVPELHDARAPGHTCIKNLLGYSYGTPEKPKNQSKGNGGVMRVAPIGLFFDSGIFDAKQIAYFGAEAAAITHGHDLGFIPAAALVLIINKIVYSNYTGEHALQQIVSDSVAQSAELFDESQHWAAFAGIMKKAVELAYSNADDFACLQQLGHGCVAEETLAIAVFCALRYQNDFEKAITVSVNHGGDSDSTGAVTGNILGAHLGYDSLPKKYLDHLELKDIILEIADDLCYGYITDNEAWDRKYSI